MKNWLSTVLMVPILVTAIAIAGILGATKYDEIQKKEIKKYHWYGDRLTYVQFSSRLLCCKGDVSIKASKGDFHKVGNIFFGTWRIKNKTYSTVYLEVQELKVSTDYLPFTHYQVSGDQKMTLLPLEETVIYVVGYLDPILLTYNADVANPPRGRGVMFSLIIRDSVGENLEQYGEHWTTPR